MQERTIEQSQRHQYLIGLLYEAMTVIQRQGQPVNYDTIATIMQHHCNQQELEATFQELARFARKIERM